MRQLLTHVKAPNIFTKLERMGQTYRRDVAEQNKIVRDQLLPQIRSQLGMEASPGNLKTVISLAVNEVRNESSSKRNWKDWKEPSPEFIDVVESQLRLFISAGHDTTAQAMCVTTVPSPCLLWTLLLTDLRKMLELHRDKQEPRRLRSPPSGA